MSKQPKLREHHSPITHNYQGPLAKVTPAVPRLNLAITDCNTLTGALVKRSHMRTAANGTLVQVNNYEIRMENTEQPRPLPCHNELQLQSQSDLQQNSLHDETADVRFNHNEMQITPHVYDQPLDSDTTALWSSLPADNTVHSDGAAQAETDINDAAVQMQQSQEDTLPGSYKAISLSPQGNFYNAKVIKVSARKPAKPQPLYKAHFPDGSQKQWLPASQIPPDILAKFFVEHHAQSQKRKFAARSPSKKGLKSEHTCITM
jgi:hypothetical protein